MATESVPKVFFDAALLRVDEAASIAKVSGEALNIAIEALVVMGTWGEPYSVEANTALGKIAEKLDEITKK